MKSPFKFLKSIYNKLDDYSKGHLVAILIGCLFVNFIYFIQGLLAGDLMLWLLVLIVTSLGVAVFVCSNID